MTRVVQWATGAVGATQLQEIIDDPELELVGLFVYSPDKVGVDAGVIVGREPVGVLATDDRDAIIALDADVVIHAASKGHGVNTNTDDIVALLESGKDVITTTSYSHLPTYGADDGGAHRRPRARRVGRASTRPASTRGSCSNGSRRRSPGSSKTIDSITVQEFADCSKVPTPEMLFDLMGMGKDPSEISSDNPMYHAISIQYEQAIHATADVLGVEIERIETRVDTAVIDHDVELALGTVRAGTVVGQVLTLDRVPRRCPVPHLRGVLGRDEGHPAVGPLGRRRAVHPDPGRGAAEACGSTSRSRTSRFRACRARSPDISWSG